MEIAEAAWDCTLNDGFVKNVPGFSLVAASYDAFSKIKERCAINKIARFLSALEHIPSSEIANYMEKLGDENERIKTGEKIILVLDRIDDLKKAEILGDLFGHYLVGLIDRAKFEMLAHALSLSYISDIEELPIYIERNDLIDDSTGNVLVAAGLAHFKVEVFDLEASGTGSTKLRFQLSSIGIYLASLMKTKKNSQDSSSK